MEIPKTFIFLQKTCMGFPVSDLLQVECTAICICTDVYVCLYVCACAYEIVCLCRNMYIFNCSICVYKKIEDFQLCMHSFISVCVYLTILNRIYSNVYVVSVFWLCVVLHMHGESTVRCECSSNIHALIKVYFPHLFPNKHCVFSNLILHKFKNFALYVSNSPKNKKKQT